MQKKTLDTIRELEKNYNVKIEKDYFEIDDCQFSEVDDKTLMVTYYVQDGTDSAGEPKYISTDELIYNELDEVEWWINSRRDY